MGYSPSGDFTCNLNGKVHWEWRHDRIVLWDGEESRKILDMQIPSAGAGWAQLGATLLATGWGDEDNQHI